jgi:hypothetical protein
VSRRAAATHQWYRIEQGPPDWHPRSRWRFVCVRCGHAIGGYVLVVQMTCDDKRAQLARTRASNWQRERADDWIARAHAEGTSYEVTPA